MLAQPIRRASAYVAPAPLNIQFNIAARVLASMTAPGWRASDDAPGEYPDLIQRTRRDGFITVWTGASDGTVFSDPETNWAFRAWHDAAHVRHGLAFDFAGEVAAAYVQAADIVGEYGDDTDAVEMVALLLCEVIGQAQFFAAYGAFPSDQMAFARANVATFTGEANRVVGTLSPYVSAEGREARAVRLAFARPL